MRILFLSDNFPPESNAPASRVHEHAACWVGQGHEVTVITGAPNFPGGKVFPGYRNRWYAREQVDGIDVVRVKSYIAPNEGFWRRTVDYLSFMVTGFVGGLVQERPHVIVATSPQIFTVLAAWLLAKVKRRPFVFELRDLWPASIVAVGSLARGRVVRVLEKLELFLYRQAAAIVSATRSFEEDLVRRGICADKIHVVYAGVSRNLFSPRRKDPTFLAHFGLEDKFVVGYVGTHGMAHGLENVLEAAERLREHTGIAFMMVGGGAEQERLARQVEARGLDNVWMIGPQPKELVPRLWSLCDIALVHLKDDPVFGTVVPSKMIEAMGMGLPILIAVPEGEATRIVREHGVGCSVAPGEPDLLAQSILALRSDPTRLRAFAEASLVASDLFSRETQAARMLEVLAGVGVGRAGPSTRDGR